MPYFFSFSQMNQGKERSEPFFFVLVGAGAAEPSRRAVIILERNAK